MPIRLLQAQQALPGPVDCQLDRIGPPRLMRRGGQRGDSELASARGGLLRIGCGPGRLSLQFENDCEQRPDWRTRKPAAVAEFRTGGYGLPIARALARRVNCRWKNGRVLVRAVFD